MPNFFKKKDKNKMKTETLENNQIEPTNDAPPVENTPVDATPVTDAPVTDTPATPINADVKPDAVPAEEATHIKKAGRPKVVLPMEKYASYSIPVLLGMSEAPGVSPQDRLEMLLVIRNRFNVELIDPTKAAAQGEKGQMKQEAKGLSAAKESFRAEMQTLFTDKQIEDFGKIAMRYINEGHGQILTFEIIGEIDAETKEFGVSTSSSISAPRKRKIKDAPKDNVPAENQENANQENAPVPELVH